MDSKILQKIIEKGIGYNNVNLSNYLKESYGDLNLPDSLSKKIANAMAANLDFEITVPEIKLMLPFLDLKIAQLLKHKDFDPFKEQLRQKYPEQYTSQPFKYKGVVYYLYTKGRDFYIDAYIYSTAGYANLLEECLKKDKPLKYMYKKPVIK
jgi:hypothetical protein